MLLNVELVFAKAINIRYVNRASPSTSSTEPQQSGVLGFPHTKAILSYTLATRVWQAPVREANFTVGSALADRISLAGIEKLLDSGVDVARFPPPFDRREIALLSALTIRLTWIT